MAEAIVAGVELMSVGSRDDEDEIVNGRIVVRLPGDRTRRIAEAGGGEKVEEKTLVRAAPVSPRSGDRGGVVGVRVPSGPSNYFSGTGRGVVGTGFGFGMEGYGYRGRGRGRGGHYYQCQLHSLSLAGLGD